MNTAILYNDIQEFIREQSEQKNGVQDFVLGKNPFPKIPIQLLAQQINGRQKALKKFPTWAAQKGLYYPPNDNLEQTSSEPTARYKSQLVSGKTLLDLTGGFGIDSYYFAKQMEQLFHCEHNEALSAMVRHNFGILGVTNSHCKAGDGLAILKQEPWKETPLELDWIYLDPSRKHAHKGKVFFLEDCEPNVVLHLDFLLSKSPNILIKTSPLLDLTSGRKSLRNVKAIHVVAVRNEVKELLWVLQANPNATPQIHAVNIGPSTTDSFVFSTTQEANAQVNYTAPKKYLYEPNAAIMKSGGFKSISVQFGLDKLHPHTHLYSSDQKIDFPGRVFEILQVLPYHKKTLGNTGLTKANISTRNFGISVATLRKKLKLGEGGNSYLFFTTLNKGKRAVLNCRKIKIA